MSTENLEVWNLEQKRIEDKKEYLKMCLEVEKRIWDKIRLEIGKRLEELEQNQKGIYEIITDMRIKSSKIMDRNVKKVFEATKDGISGIFPAIQEKERESEQNIKVLPSTSIFERNLEVVVFDLEIKREISEISGGWRNHKEMGISFASIYSFKTDRFLVFDWTEESIREMVEVLNNADYRVTFNGLKFDYKVIEALGYTLLPKPEYDVLQEVWRAAGLGEDFNKDTHYGFGLEKCSLGTLKRGKIGKGELAPVWFKQGKYGKLVTYNMDDVALTRDLLKFIDRTGQLIVKDKGRFNVARPESKFDVPDYNKIDQPKVSVLKEVADFENKTQKGQYEGR